MQVSFVVVFRDHFIWNWLCVCVCVCACACACACVCVCVCVYATLQLTLADYWEFLTFENSWLLRISDFWEFLTFENFLASRVFEPTFLYSWLSNTLTADFRECVMGWLRLVGSLKLQVSFAEYRLFYPFSKETYHFKEPTSHSHPIPMSGIESLTFGTKKWYLQLDFRERWHLTFDNFRLLRISDFWELLSMQNVWLHVL